MNKLGPLLFFVVSLALAPAARGGHEPPIYPSYYPQEIRIEPLDATAAAAALLENRIQAYVGGAPAFAGAVPEFIDFVESLGSYLVLRLNPEPAGRWEGRSGCEVARTVAGAIAGEGKEKGFVFHPYPVNGFHDDYLHHFDLAEAAVERLADRPGAEGKRLAVRATGGLAESLVGDRWPVEDGDWDASLEEVDAGDLVAASRTATIDWQGPPWIKKGWFHAYLLLADSLAEEAAKGRAERLFQRLRRDDHKQAEERINLERELVSVLVGSCRKTVVGYTLKREYFSFEYNAGIENIAYDSHAGFNSEIFVRTVKLKDFPWNGWLTLGVESPPAAAWNPIAGFTDETGRLIWSAIGDSGLFPHPYNSGWTLNRIGNVIPAAGR